MTTINGFRPLQQQGTTAPSPVTPAPPNAPRRTVEDCRRERAGVMRMYGWGFRAALVVGPLALMFTMVNVQIFGSAGHEPGHNLPDTFQWLIAWILDPMASIGLGAAIVLEILLARYGRHEPWLTAVKWFAGAMTWTMNIWPAVVHPGPYGPVAAVILHSLAPGLVLGLAEAAPRVRRRVFEIVAELECEAQSIEAAGEAARISQLRADADARQVEIDEKRAEAERIRREKAGEEKVRQDRLDGIREIEARADADAKATSRSEAEAAVIKLRIDADKAEAARLREERRAAGQSGGQGADRRGDTKPDKAADNGGQRRGQDGGQQADRTASPDVSDLLAPGRKVAADLAQADCDLTRSALVSGLRSAGLSCSTARAVELLVRLKAERAEADTATERDAHRNGPRLVSVAGS